MKKILIFFTALNEIYLVFTSKKYISSVYYVQLSSFRFHFCEKIFKLFIPNETDNIHKIVFNILVCPIIHYKE